MANLKFFGILLLFYFFLEKYEMIYFIILQVWVFFKSCDMLFLCFFTKFFPDSIGSTFFYSVLDIISNSNNTYTLSNVNLKLVRGPVFVDNSLFFLSLHFSEWENYFYYFSQYNFLFFNNHYSSHHLLSHLNNFFLLSHYNITSDFFFNQIYLHTPFYKDFFYTESFLPQFNYGTTFWSEKLYYRFPRRNYRFLLNEYHLSIFQTFSEFYFPKNYSKYSQLFDKIYNQYQSLYVDPTLSKNSHLYKWLDSYFEFYNSKMNMFLGSNNENSGFCYYVSNVQKLHLLKLTYSEIQSILYLLQNDPLFRNLTFLDVHWELYSSSNFSSHLDNLYTIRPGIIKFLEYSGLFSNIIHFGLYNPFELIMINDSVISNFYKNKCYFTDAEICTLPFHILLSVGNHVNFDQFFINDFLINSRSQFLFQFFFSNDFYYSQKLFQYQQFSVYTRTALLNFLSDDFYYKLPYQRFDVSIENPWWESLNNDSRQKFIFLLQNMSFQNSHLILSYLIDRYLNGSSFYTMDEITKIIDIKKQPFFSPSSYSLFFLFFLSDQFDQLFNSLFFNYFVFYSFNSLFFNSYIEFDSVTLNLTDLFLLNNGYLVELKFESFFLHTKFLYSFELFDLIDMYFEFLYVDFSFLLELENFFYLQQLESLFYYSFCYINEDFDNINILYLEKYCFKNYLFLYNLYKDWFENFFIINNVKFFTYFEPFSHFVYYYRYFLLDFS